MSDSEFSVTWEADDGYCGGSRPQHFEIPSDVLDPSMDEKALRELFWEEVKTDFNQRVEPVCDQEEEFVEWAKERIAAMEADDA